MTAPSVSGEAWDAVKAEMRKCRAWWALYDPVAFVWLCRAERRGAIVPWSEEAGPAAEPGD
jgi:hypothetical protein